MSKTVIISGYYGFENFGDELILGTLVWHLKSWGYQPLVLSDNPRVTQESYQCESIQRTNLQALWPALKSAKAFISGGGGLFQDVTGPASPLYYGGLIQLATWAKCPTAFFAQGVGPLKSWLGKTMTGRALSQCGLISVRDIKSRALVSELSQQSASLVADPVWTWQLPEDFQPQDKQGLGVSLRPWGGLGHDGLDHLARCIAKLRVAESEGVNLIDCQSGSDIVPLSQLEMILKKLGVECRWFSGSKIIEGIAQSKALLAMRFHALVIGAQLGLEMMALSYDPKVQFLAAGLKIPDSPVLVLESLTAQHIRTQLRAADDEALAQLKINSEKGFTQLRQWLEKL